jgi:hypothetical protein
LKREAEIASILARSVARAIRASRSLVGKASHATDAHATALGDGLALSLEAGAFQDRITEPA